jgi:hypothetical protein
MVNEVQNGPWLRRRPASRRLARRRTPRRKRALTMSEKFARARICWSVVDLEVTAPTRHPRANAVAASRKTRRVGAFSFRRTARPRA